MTQPRIAFGTPQSRVDGRLKVTGAASYAADQAIDGVAYAVMVDSTVGLGRITAIDTRDALAHPGVLQVISHTNSPRLAYRDIEGSGNPPNTRLEVFQDDRVLFFGQPVAVVVAVSLESAQQGARLVSISYESQAPSTNLADAQPDPPTVYKRGDTDAVFGTVPVRLEMTYRTARNHHNPMEPHATIARWNGDQLTVWDKTQWVGGTQRELASVFGISQDAVRVISPFVGGAFGSGLRAWPHVTVAALAAREMARPVKLVLSRRQLYFGTGYRPSYTYQLALSSNRDGRLTAMTHDIRGETSSYETFTEEVLAPGQMLYSVPNVAQSYSVVPLNVNSPIWMRGPGMTTAVTAVESAMDELAYKLKMDPIELRLRNEPENDQSTGFPFSTRRLRECYSTGAREFGWSRRNPQPRSTTDGDWLIGTGMAAAIYGPSRMPAKAHARINANGSALVQAATSDMGPGTYTSMSQVAADALGLPMRSVVFELGDSNMPPTPPHGGSMTMGCVGSAVQDACDKVRQQAITIAINDSRSPLYGTRVTDVLVRDGRLQLRKDYLRGETYQQLLARNNRSHLEMIGSFSPAEQTQFSMYSYGAVFAEVAVDARLGTVRVRRMLGVYDAGRLVNPKLANSQAIGGLTGGIGGALLEHTVTDPRDGRIVNANLADYLVPVNADITDLRAIYLPGGDDAQYSSIGVKGLGEIVITGVTPAIGNAVFHATGRRIRDFPITAEALL